MNKSISRVDPDQLEQLLSQLVEINSVNPWITEGAPGEGAVAAMLAERLGAIPGVAVELDEVAPGRPNVIARLRGAAEGRTLCVNVHTDTVDCLGWEDRAFVPRREGDRLIGLGATDNKGQCASLVLAMEILAHEPPPGETVAVFAIDEEGPSLGSHRIVESLRADGALVLEPVGIGNACIAHQGFGSLELVVRAVAAHGLDEDAVDAGLQLARLVVGLERIDKEVLAPNPHPLVGKAFFHTSWFRGGTDYGTYPSELALGFEFGTVPGETLANRVAEIEDLIAEQRTADPSLDAELRVVLDNDPFWAEGHEELLEAYSAATKETLGRPAATTGWPTWGDSAITQGAGIPTLLVGGDGDRLHATDEWASIPSLVQLTHVLVGSARRFQALPSGR